MSRKTPAHVIKLLESYETRMVHLEEMLRVKKTVPVENQSSFIRENSEEYFMGMIQGVVSMMDSVLHEFNCYHGFYYVGADRKPLEHVVGQKIQENPEYRDWRISFYSIVS